MEWYVISCLLVPLITATLWFRHAFANEDSNPVPATPSFFGHLDPEFELEPLATEETEKWFFHPIHAPCDGIVAITTVDEVSPLRYLASILRHGRLSGSVALTETYVMDGSWVKAGQLLGYCRSAHLPKDDDILVVLENGCVAPARTESGCLDS